MGDIEMGHARALLPLEHDKQIQVSINKLWTKSLLSVDRERLVEKNFQVDWKNEDSKPACLI